MALSAPTSAVAPAAVLLAACAAAAPRAQDVPTPADHLGRPVGTDFELADWEQTRTYYEELAASPTVLVDRLGTSTQGRPYLRAVISSPSNLARLDELRTAAARIADPRGLTEPEREALLDAAKPIVMVACHMHSTETAGTEFGMEFAHTLATSDEEPWASAREELVVVVIPNVNPDGLDIVVEWWREHVGTPFEGAGTLELYQHYAGHDNNRDWFGLALEETRLVTNEIYSVWHPTVYWDVHQQGGSEERFFVPPFRDPLNPNLDPAIIAGIDLIGSRALFDLTKAGFTGVSTGVSYDMWWNGGNRNVPVRHNIIGLLTEAASVDVAAPVFYERSRLGAPGDLPSYGPSNRFPAPWPGGWWRLRDIIDYEMAFGASLLGTLAREPELFLSNAMEAAQRTADRGASEAPRAWVVPSDGRAVGGARRLADILLTTGVEVYVSEGPVEADGRTWPAGSMVVPRAQPYGQWVKDLMEVQRYPEGPPPYDVSGWTLPLLLGVHRVESVQAIEEGLRRVHTAAEAVAAFAGRSSGGALDTSDSDSWVAAWRHLDGGGGVRLAADGLELTSGADDGGATDLPRVGLYAPWSSSMNEGWMRWVLDTFEVPYARVRNEQLRAGRLADMLDVLVITNVSGRQLDRGRAPGSVPTDFAGGLDPEGAVAVEEFVRGGGRLVVMSGSASWANELFGLGLVDSSRSGDFSCPGSVLRTVPTDDELSVGLPASLPVFFSRASAYDVEASDARRVMLRYAPTRLLLSGYVQGPEAIEGDAAWVRASYGDGAVDLFGFRPQYRSWSQASFELLFRAILF